MKIVQNCTDIQGIEVSDGLFLVSDEIQGEPVSDLVSAFPDRVDLPKEHPLYGVKVLAFVPAGCCDIEVTTEGLIEKAVVGSPMVESETGLEPE